MAGIVASAHGAHRRRHRHAPEPPPAVALSSIRVYGGVPAPFALYAKAEMLVDAHSGAVLYAFNEHERIQPASLAKIMTFYLTLEALHAGRITLDTEVPISEAAWRLSLNRSVSRMFLQVGQQVKVRDLLYGLVVSSGNDAAVALAEYLGGSADGFAAQMNRTAKKLELTETHFENPDGLPVEGQYTTAADMVKLARAVITRFPDALTYTSTKEFTFDRIRQRNFNTLLFYDSRVNGLKTGHVEEAGFHLVATARAGSTELISALLGAPSAQKRRTETEKLIDWAFRTYDTVEPQWQKAMPATLPVYEGAAPEVAIAPASVPYVTVLKGKEASVATAAALQSGYVIAPVSKGARVGELTISVGGQPAATVPVETEAAVGQGGFLKRVADRVRLML